MNRRAWIDGVQHTLTPAALLGQGGEAEVYDLGDGRVLKWWKPADHPDYDGMPDAQAAARRRLAEHPAKLRALPGRLPSAVVAPCGFALASKRSTQIVGYLMPRVTGVPLHSFGEPRWRREHPVDGETVVGALLSLHAAIAALHAAGVVIGDCNDLNVLVDGRRVHLIDVDSYQFGGFTCPMFSERFVDPRLCSSQQLVPVHPHDVASDWFAFAVMAFRSLLGIGPWGGVHQPADPLDRCPPVLRALRRISVFAAGIVYPRAARPLAILPDELTDLFRAVFERDQRGEFPRSALERLRLRACSTCGDEHGRVRCPTCQTATQLPPAIVHGRLRWTTIGIADVEAAAYEVQGAARGRGHVWLDAGALWRMTRIGAERIGGVLSGQTRAWCGARLGVGFYRAGGYAVGFVFRPDRGVLDDRVALPRLRGQLVDAHATIGDDRAWLWLTTVDAGRLVTTCVVIDATAQVLATSTLADAPWISGIGGGCTAGPHLFVPTDEGLARIEIVQGVITQTRTFAETAAVVGPGDRLALSPGGIDAIRRRDAIRMQLT
ncbi:MAG: hypothetical protein H0T42_15735 [Deltaproteobacteria bacterium]|nr:hypothetical protein [Deltaproteobacteria bacterium]